MKRYDSFPLVSFSGQERAGELVSEARDALGNDEIDNAIAKLVPFGLQQSTAVPLFFFLFFSLLPSASTHFPLVLISLPPVYQTAAIQLDCTARTLALRAKAFIAAKKPKAAKRDCDHALSLNPDSAAALKVRGKEKKKKEKKEKNKKRCGAQGGSYISVNRSSVNILRRSLTLLLPASLMFLFLIPLLFFFFYSGHVRWRCSSAAART